MKQHMHWWGLMMLIPALAQASNARLAGAK